MQTSNLLGQLIYFSYFRQFSSKSKTGQSPQKKLRLPCQTLTGGCWDTLSRQGSIELSPSKFPPVCATTDIRTYYVLQLVETFLEWYMFPFNTCSSLCAEHLIYLNAPLKTQIYSISFIQKLDRPTRMFTSTKRSALVLILLSIRIPSTCDTLLLTR